MNIDLTVGMDDHALYAPAINDGFARTVGTPSAGHRNLHPGGGAATDLNYLDPDCPYFHYNAGLYSAAFGVYDRSPTIVSRRDRKRTIIIGDSGGFSAISGALPDPLPVFRPKSLAWQEQQCDVGIILDLPTRVLDSPAGQTRTFQDCLGTTLDSIRFAIENRSKPDMILLTVMQGRNRKEARAWRQAVAPYQPSFEGIALAGDTKLDLALWMQELIEMRDANQLDRFRWLHVLGTTRPGIAVILTGLQRALRKHLHPEIRVSFDSSLAFRIVQVNKHITTGIAYDRKRISFQRYRFPDHWSALDRNARFPFSSPLGDKCRFGDFNPANEGSQTGWDTLGGLMLSHHEVYKEVAALGEANRLAEAEVRVTGETPWHIRKAWEGFDAIFSSKTPDVEIARYRSYLNHYAGPTALEDDER